VILQKENGFSFWDHQCSGIYLTNPTSPDEIE